MTLLYIATFETKTDDNRQFTDFLGFSQLCASKETVERSHGETLYVLKPRKKTQLALKTSF